jgi:hypothetical protein
MKSFHFKEDGEPGDPENEKFREREIRRLKSSESEKSGA